MSIHILPQTTVRAIGSSQSLTDSASLVKELLDNAIDARATSVSIEVSGNTLDVIQVRDNGHGIAPKDRSLVGKRYCTSKIKDEKDLRTIGGLFLGFRGEALSSAAEMSAAMTITTRVEGEDIATAMKINSSGEIESQDRASHLVGTTVRITGFLSNLPVRSQVALKSTGTTIVKIRQVLKSYAFARPALRLSFRILKSKSDRDNWVYAPKVGADAGEAALKVLGKPCASQCAWLRTELQGFQICAYMPRVDADMASISGTGQYISVDGRTMNSSKGVCKKITKLFKDSMKGAGMCVEGIKEPFMFMSITCPEASYDPNIEPAKDDVLFGDVDLVIAAVQNLFENAYPAAPASVPISVPSCMEQYEDSTRTASAAVVNLLEGMDPKLPSQKSAMKFNMYDMDEDDLELMATLADGSAQDFDYDEEQKENVGPTSSNPWIMAKMNGRTGHAKFGDAEVTQLVTPAKEVGDEFQASSSPIKPSILPTTRSALPTPRGSSPEVHTTKLPAAHSHARQTSALAPLRAPDLSVMDVSPSDMPRQPSRPQAKIVGGMTIDQIPEATHSRRRATPSKAQRRYVNKPFKPPVDPERDAWFDIAETDAPNHRISRRKVGSQPVLAPRGEPLDNPQPTTLSRPANHADIRSFIAPKRAAPLLIEEDLQLVSSVVADEDSAPRADRVRKSARRLASGDFVLASDLEPCMPLERAPDYHESPLSLRPARHKNSDKRALAEGTGGGGITCVATTMANNDYDDADDPSYEPESAAAVARKRQHRTANGNKQKISRTKSSQLPLERVNPELYMQNTSMISPMAAAEAVADLLSANVDERSLAWNKPAVGCESAFDLIQEEEIEVWSVAVKELLTKQYPHSSEMGLNDVVDVVRAGLVDVVLHI